MDPCSLVLETLFVFANGRIATTREPSARRAPAFVLVRDATSCAWAVGAHVARQLAETLDALAGEEQPSADPQQPPRHEARYRELVGDAVMFGPGFLFPDPIAAPAQPIEVIADEQPLVHHFRGWVPGEIAGGCAPVMAIVVDGKPVSVCFSARSSEVAAAAGVETAAPFRGRGYAVAVTAAWARAIRASGRIPMYGTAWTNHSSIAVARKLGLIAHASSWSSGWTQGLG